MLVPFRKTKRTAAGHRCDLQAVTLEIGTGDDAGLIHGQALVGPKCDRLRPGQLVLVIKWVAGSHFLALL
jgi:hypothetical protein